MKTEINKEGKRSMNTTISYIGPLASWSPNRDRTGHKTMQGRGGYFCMFIKDFSHPC
jgi:hypothetical protein